MIQYLLCLFFGHEWPSSWQTIFQGRSGKKECRFCRRCDFKEDRTNGFFWVDELLENMSLHSFPIGLSPDALARSREVLDRMEDDLG